MTKYLKIAPDPDSKPCRCGDGNPDCDHFEFCPECGEEYKAHEGHDCLDGFAVAQVGTAKELRDAAKELRDSLDACETERDRLRAELDAAHDGEDALRSEVARLRAQIAALHPEERRVGPDEVVVGREEWEVIEQILNVSEICANEGVTDRRCCVQTDDHHIPLTRLRAIRSLRTSAQAHNGARSVMDAASEAVYAADELLRALAAGGEGC